MAGIPRGWWSSEGGASSTASWTPCGRRPTSPLCSSPTPPTGPPGGPPSAPFPTWAAVAAARGGIGFHADVTVGTLPLERVRALGDPDLLFFNVNAPADLERAEAAWRQRG